MLDALTSIRVYRVLDNARTQDAEYSALNADNTIMYYVQGTTGNVVNLTWDLVNGTVNRTSPRVAFGGSGPFGAVDGVIWDRADRKTLYFSGLNNGRIYKRDIVNNLTVLLKDFGADPAFLAFWSARGLSIGEIRGLHADRVQDKFVALVVAVNSGPVVGVVAWDKSDSRIWNYSSPAGKTATRTVLDDSGEYFQVQFSDGTWEYVELLSNNFILPLGVLASADPPTRVDSTTLKLFQADGVGVKSRPFANPSSQTTIFAHPLLSSKTDTQSKAKMSMQDLYDVCYYGMYYGGSLSHSWVSLGGGVYMMDWGAVMVADSNRRVPEVVRAGRTQLVKVSFATALSQGQWKYDTTNDRLHVRLAGNANPASQPMVVFDWRFGTEEIVMVNQALSTLRGRLCRHFHYGYPADPDVGRASVAYDGSRVMFTSNWGGQAQTNIYGAIVIPPVVGSALRTMLGTWGLPQSRWGTDPTPDAGGVTNQNGAAYVQSGGYIDVARSKGGSLSIKMYGSNNNVRNPDRSYSVSLANAIFDTWITGVRSVSGGETKLRLAVRDGTVRFMIVLDDFTTGGTSGNAFLNPVIYEEIESTCQHIKAQIPWMPLVARGPNTYLKTTASNAGLGPRINGVRQYQYLDSGYLQFRPKLDGAVTTYVTNQVNAGIACGAGSVGALNLLNMGAGTTPGWGCIQADDSGTCGCSPTEIHDTGHAMLNNVRVVGFTSWAYDGGSGLGHTYWDLAAIQAAYQEVRDTYGGRTEGLINIRGDLVPA